MSTDPFHTFQSTVESSLRSAQDLSRAYLASPPSQQQTAHDRLLDAIDALKQDLEDVRQSVNVVRRSPERFGVGEMELQKREGFLSQCEAQVEQLERDAGDQRGGAAGGRGKQRDYTSIDMRRDGDDDEDGDPQNAFEREYQQVRVKAKTTEQNCSVGLGLTVSVLFMQSLITNQDSILTTIGRTLNTLKSQASTMGNELSEQNELIQTFDQEVEQSSTRLGKAMDKMNDFTRQADGWTGGWTVWILIVVSAGAGACAARKRYKPRSLTVPLYARPTHPQLLFFLLLVAILI